MVDSYEELNCNMLHGYQKSMFQIAKLLRTRISQQISNGSTLIYQFLLPLCSFLIVSLIILCQFY